MLGPTAETLPLVLGPRREHQNRVAGTLRSGAAVAGQLMIGGRDEYALAAPVPPREEGGRVGAAGCAGQGVVLTHRHWTLSAQDLHRYRLN
jgi:hypothetical protein